MLMAYNLYKEKVEVIRSQAMAIEIYHNYTLLHDDLMDRADMRRGMATVHKKWDDNAAILSGDSMLVMAYRYMQQGCPAEQLGNVMGLFTETALEIGEGQQYDIEFETRADVKRRRIYRDDSFEDIRIVGLRAENRGMVGECPRQDAELLYRFGENLGLAFQLQDDYLDVYGDPAVFGKKIGGDILCNKKTYMLINALGRALPADRERLEQWLEKEEGTYAPEEKIAAVTELYDKMGIRALCDEKIRFYFERAREILDKVNLPEERKEPLWEMAQSLLNRKS